MYEKSLSQPFFELLIHVDLKFFKFFQLWRVYFIVSVEICVQSIDLFLKFLFPLHQLVQVTLAYLLDRPLGSWNRSLKLFKRVSPVDVEMFVLHFFEWKFLKR